MDTKHNLRVLIAPLDWGFGHATRCIPLIKAFSTCDCTVVIACNGVAKRILEPEFPHLLYLPLEGYNIRYSSSKQKFALTILFQIPNIIKAIRREHRWLKKTVNEHNIDVVISDNRYGFYHITKPSVFITHQLLIQTPFRWLTTWIQKINYRFINRFKECWVPDFASEVNMAGDLSHPLKKPSVPVVYLGMLSRFLRKEGAKITYKWLFVLSGPEPQRTILEDKLIKAVSSITSAVLFVRGLPGSKDVLNLPENITVCNYLSTAELNKAFAQSEYIVTRSGYTTVMEILAMQKKSILIPTPGQTEQEYLARHLMKQQWCYVMQQNESIEPHLQQAELFDYSLPQLPSISVTETISNFVSKIINKKILNSNSDNKL